MTVLIVLVGVIIFYFLTKRKSTPSPQTSKKVTTDQSVTRQEKEKDSFYNNQILEFDVKGIFAERKRRKLFDNLNTSSVITLELDYNNKHDKYAIKVNVDEEQIGNISKGNRKLFRTLESTPNYIISISNQYSYFKKEINDTKYLLSLKVHVGFNKSEIEVLNKYYSLNNKFKDLYKSKKMEEANACAEKIFNETKYILNELNLKKVFKKHSLSSFTDINSITICALKLNNLNFCMDIFNLYKPYTKPGKLLLNRIQKVESILNKPITKG